MGDVIAVLLCLSPFIGGVLLAIRQIRSDARRHDSVKAQLSAVGAPVATVSDRLFLFDGPPRIGMFFADGGELVVHPLTADTSVTVETAGSITAVRGRNLAAKAVGGALTGGLGLFVFGNAKTETIDSRELYVVVESSTFAHVQPLDPAWGQVARQFAAQTTMMARRLAGQQ